VNSRLLMALATPLLMLLAFLGLFGVGQRQGAERLQALPAVLICSGLLVAGSAGYGHRRRQLLRALREREPTP
jgi:hypothetical protein